MERESQHTDRIEGALSTGPRRTPDGLLRCNLRRLVLIAGLLMIHGAFTCHAGDGVVRKYALLVEVADYTALSTWWNPLTWGTINPLTYFGIRGKGEDLKNALVSELGFAEQNVSYLRHWALPANTATSTAIRDFLEGLSDNGVDNDDVVVFYFVGHSTASSLLLGDPNDNYLIYPSDLANWLPVEPTLILVLDTCFAGSFSRSFASARTFRCMASLCSSDVASDVFLGGEGAWGTEMTSGVTEAIEDGLLSVTAIFGLASQMARRPPPRTQNPVLVTEGSSASFARWFTASLLDSEGEALDRQTLVGTVFPVVLETDIPEATATECQAVLLVDGQTKLIDGIGPEFGFPNWNTEDLTPGDYVLEVRVMKGEDILATRTATVTIQHDATPPSITAWSHNNGEEVAGTVTIVVGTPVDEGVASVEFCHGYGELPEGEDSRTAGTRSGSNWTYTIDTTGTSYATDLWVGARATDTSGNQSTWYVLQLTIDNRTAGTVTLTRSPTGELDFGTVNPGDQPSLSVTLSASGLGTAAWTASDDGGLDLVYPASGQLTVDGDPATQVFTIVISTAGLAEGQSHTGTISIASAAGNLSIPCRVSIREGANNVTLPPDQDLTIHWTNTGGTTKINDGELLIGNRDNVESWWSLLHFDTSSLQGKVVVDAELQLYKVSGGTSASLSATVNNVGFSWTEGSPDSTFSSIGAYTLLNPLYSSWVYGSSGYWQIWDSGSESFTGLVKSWVETPSVNNGIAVMNNSGGFGGDGEVKHFASRSQTSYRPKLTVSYSDFEDEEGPTIAVTSHGDGQHVTQPSITLAGTCHDLSGIAWVRVNAGDANGTSNWSKSVSLSPGANTITVSAADQAFVTHTSSQQLTIHYDEPDFAVTLSAETLTLNPGAAGDVTLVLSSISDFSSEVTPSCPSPPLGLQVAFAPGAVTPSGAAVVQVTADETLAAGTYVLTLTGTGGGKTHSAALEVYVRSRPSLGIATPASDVTVSHGTTDQAFAGTTTSDGNVAFVEYRQNGGSWRTATGTSAWSFTATGLHVGTNLVEVRCFDDRGLRSPTSVRVISREGNERPTITISDPVVSPVLPNEETSVGFSGTAEDVDGTVALVQYCRDDGAWTDATGTTAWSFTVTGLQEGLTVIQVRAIDNYGLESWGLSRGVTRSGVIEEDLNDDGTVDVADMDVAAQYVGRKVDDGESPLWEVLGDESLPDRCDRNGDGEVDVYDLVIISKAFTEGGGE